MTSLLEQTRALAESSALKFKDCGNGHVQISGHGRLVNYWPESKKRTAMSDTGRKEVNCSPWDAVRMCMTESAEGMKPKKIPKNRPDFSLKPIITNPAKLKHFYDGDKPPWEEDNDHVMPWSTDELRLSAYRLHCDAQRLWAEADSIDQEVAA